MTYYLYHIPGKKIGVTNDLYNRVECQQGYEARNANGNVVAADAYICKAGESMTLPSLLQCSPKKCVLPVQLGNNVVGAGTLPCVSGSALEHGITFVREATSK